MHDISKSSDTFFLGHPKGLVTLFLTEMWERMSFYGMRGLLVLFMTREVAEGGMNLDAPEAMASYGIYGASVYFLCVPGGPEYSSLRWSYYISRSLCAGNSL